ncbi:MAG: TolB protein [Pseudohongiellaceae bacterium]|jgi:TolB protein
MKLCPSVAWLVVASALLSVGCASAVIDHTRLGEGAHMSNVRQLTFGGTNAEAYWSYDNDELILQITNKNLHHDGVVRGFTVCDQIFTIDVESTELTELTNAGRTTCGFFMPGRDRVVYGSTHEAGIACPPKADRSQGYVWDVYDTFEIYAADPDGGNVVNMTNTPGYDAEATISRDGRIAFTSMRSGDLELWTMNLDGGELQQLTDRPGYDGGAFFNNAGTQIVWRSTRFDSQEEIDEYWGLIARNLVKPAKMELWIADADGSNMRQLTDNSCANFAPFFSPDDRSILFSSNLGGGPGSFDFDIWKMDLETGEQEQITHSLGFDCFPMFSWDGKRIAFTSARSKIFQGDLNVFVADWTP